MTVGGENHGVDAAGLAAQLPDLFSRRHVPDPDRPAEHALLEEERLFAGGEECAAGGEGQAIEWNVVSQFADYLAFLARPETHRLLPGAARRHELAVRRETH